MPLETIEFKGHTYPAWQAKGFSAQFAFPFAKHVCIGTGVDVGPNRPEWAFPGAFVVDPVLNDEYHATKFPDELTGLDYVFSSHVAEHLTHPYTAFNYWHSRLKKGGIICLYLPSAENLYWRPWNKGNSPHLHQFTPEIIKSYFEDQPNMWGKTFVSGIDLNSSFLAISEKV